MNKRVQLLDKKQTVQKIRRIAHEILEQNFKEKEIVFVGIVDLGYVFAEMLQTFFNEISEIPTRLVKIELDKLAPLQSEIVLECQLDQLKNQVIILADDVLNTGRTLAYSIKPFLSVEIKKLQTAIIVDRGYHTFPISADYVGYSLATSTQENIVVELSETDTGVYLE
tara:strand:+ start:5184 stop:5687 length:504 start_codon:yes stop_codon:yes gene_type:complete